MPMITVAVDGQRQQQVRLDAEDRDFGHDGGFE